MIIIDGKKLSKEILDEVKKEIAVLPFVPLFSDVLVGNDRASVKYVKMKAKMAENMGMIFQNGYFPDSINTETLVKEIKKLNNIKNMCGIIVQLPLSSHLDKRKVLDAIDPGLDVDCLGKIASKKFYMGGNVLNPPTALACMYILETLNLNLKSKSVVVLGQGQLVGKPIFALLSQRGISSIALRSKTEHKAQILKNADVIISGIGEGNFIKGDMIKKGAIIIDAGTSESGGILVGDVDFDSVKDVASYLTPVPGGVGPLTIAMLFKNVLEVAKSFVKNRTFGSMI